MKQLSLLQEYDGFWEHHGPVILQLAHGVDVEKVQELPDIEMDGFNLRIGTLGEHTTRVQHLHGTLWIRCGDTLLPLSVLRIAKITDQSGAMLLFNPEPQTH